MDEPSTSQNGWDMHRMTIQGLYQEQNLPLKEVVKIMGRQYKFHATERMFKSRINTWGLEKKLKQSDVVQLLRLRHEREAKGKPSSVFTVRGRTVDWDRVNTYIKRKGLDVSAILNAVDSGSLVLKLSPDIICRTPSPDPLDNYQPVHPEPVAADSQGMLYLSPSLLLRMRQAITCDIEEKHDQWTAVENERSREWTTIIRYKLALHRGFIESQKGIKTIRQFRKLNRGLALLEPASGNHIGTRLFYLMNFIICFRRDGFLADNPLSQTASRLEEELRSLYATSSRANTILRGEMKPICITFLTGILRNLVKSLGLKFSAESILLLEESDRGRPALETQQLATHCLAGIMHTREGNNETKDPKEGLDCAIWLLSQGLDQEARDILLRLLEGPTTSRQTMALSRCASYHLARMYKRQGDIASAESYNLKSVRDSLFLDSWLTWDEASFLFA